jgi:P pilus assembly chaperone PapD
MLLNLIWKNMKNNLLHKSAQTFSVFLSTLLISKAALAGNLMVSPSRVELNNKQLTQEVQLVNKGSETSTYRISFQHLRMTENGTYEEIQKGKEGKEKFADNLVRFSPKQVTLKPGEIQTVRLMFKRSSNIDPGEYRSHLLLKEEAPADFGANVEKNEKNTKQISVVLKPLFGISIPVIVRSGAVTANASIKNLAIKTDAKDNQILSVELARTGNGSTYGNINVSLTPKNSDKKYDIGTVSNVAVFYPNENRKINVPLTLPKDVSLEDGVLNVSYQAPKLLAQKVMNLESKNN